jgi:hypothetical protein
MDYEPLGEGKAINSNEILPKKQLTKSRLEKWFELILPSILPTALAFGTLLHVYNTGLLDIKNERLENRKTLLAIEIEKFEGQKTTMIRQIAKLKIDSNNLINTIDSLAETIIKKERNITSANSRYAEINDKYEMKNIEYMKASHEAERVSKLLGNYEGLTERLLNLPHSFL